MWTNRDSHDNARHMATESNGQPNHALLCITVQAHYLSRLIVTSTSHMYTNQPVGDAKGKLF